MPPTQELPATKDEPMVQDEEPPPPLDEDYGSANETTLVQDEADNAEEAQEEPVNAKK